MRPVAQKCILVLESLPRKTPVEHLNTQRLRIERLRADHAPTLVGPLQDEDIYTWIPEDAPTLTALQARYDFLEAGRSPDGEERWLNWVAFLRDSSNPVGTFQVTLPRNGIGSFAYIVFPPFWRQGYAREMAVCILEHIFEVYEASTLFAEIDTRNMPSIKLVESLGLTRGETTRNADFFKGSSSDEYRYSIERQGWQSIRSFK